MPREAVFEDSMELLLSALGLIVSTLQGILTANSERASTEKHKIGRELADTVVRLDAILSHAISIISHIESMATRSRVLPEEVAEFESLMKMQSKDVRELAGNTLFLGEKEPGKTPNRWLEGTQRVVRIFGDRARDLPNLLDAKGGMMTELQTFAENAYVASYDGRLLLRHYKRRKPANAPDSYYDPVGSKLSIEVRIEGGWLVYSDIDLRNPRLRRKYLNELRDQLSELKSARTTIVHMLQTHFEVEDLV
jgi:hypothetical protein